MSHGTKYFVVDENTLCYQQPGQTDLGILHASVLRGATSGINQGTIPMPMDESRKRPALLKDFEEYRVSPKGHLVNTGETWETLSMNMKMSILAGETLIDGHLLAENDELVAMMKRGESQDACLYFINGNY